MTAYHAVLSDIHGNRWALEAVLKDLDQYEIEQIYNLGDSLYGPLDPVGTAEILMEMNILSVNGNEDYDIFDIPEDLTDHPTLLYVRNQLYFHQIHWLKSIPMKQHEGDFLLFHGTPTNVNDYLLYDITPAGKKLVPEEKLSGILSGVVGKIILCGHDHTPNLRHLPDGRMVINPGSVGLQAFSDDKPYPHSFAKGTPHARYCLLYHKEGNWHVDFRSVEYDWESAAQAAENNERPDWANWLRTGKIS